MADRRYRTKSSGVDIFEGGVTPLERISEANLARTPEAFSYAELDKKYPTRQVRPIIPTYIQRELDEDFLEQKEQLAMQKAREAQASIYESQLNERILSAEQVPLARAAFSQLNPQDSNYLQKRDEILTNYPYAENDTSFMRTIVGRNDRTYDNWAKKNIGVSPMNLDDYGKAVKEIGDIERAARDLGEEPSDAQKKYMGYRAAQIKQFESQQGDMKGGNEIGMPISIQSPTGAMSFSSVEEADSSGLPTGTIVYINGRKARID